MISIYVVINLVNEKLYVGQSKNYKKRYQNHLDAKTSMRLHKAIRKYGVQSFRFQIVETHETQEDADDAERFFIEYLRTRTYQHGYNDTSGGNVFEHSKEARQKMSEAKKRWNASLSPEIRLARSRHANDSMSAEERRHNATKASLSIPLEQRVLNGRKGAAASATSMNHEQRVEMGKIAWLNSTKKDSPRRTACAEGCRAWWASLSLEERQARSKKMHEAKAARATSKRQSTNE